MQRHIIILHIYVSSDELYALCPAVMSFFTKYRPRPWFCYLLRPFSVPAHTVLLAITEVVLTKTDEGKGFVVIVTTGNFIQPESPSEPTVPIYCGSQRLPSAFLGKCFVSHANGWMALIGSQSHQNSPHFSKKCPSYSRATSLQNKSVKAAFSLAPPVAIMTD